MDKSARFLMKNIHLKSAASLGAVIFSLFSFQSIAGTFLTETFEGLALGAYVSPTESGGSGADWTAAGPSGWVRDNSTTPVGSPEEFYGWNFHNKDSWIATEGDQDRSLFTLGSGIVLLADPDAYDDGTDIDTALFNAYITTPVFSLAGVGADSVNISFDSSFRAEPTQIGLLDVSFDGGATFSNLLTLDGNTIPDEERINEHLSFDVSNPDSGDLVFRFGLVEGSNDWWWAVDNVSITGDTGAIPEPSSVLLLALGGATVFLRRRR